MEERIRLIGMPLFIVKNNPGFKNPVVLSKEDEHHLVRVLRAERGQSLTITDNHGQTLQVEIVSLKPLTFKILRKETKPAPVPITVCLPLIEQTRLEWAIEKLCELNVQSVQLISTERCQWGTLSAKKMERLFKIAEAAQKQCERAWPLLISHPLSLTQIVIDPQRQNWFGHQRAYELKESTISNQNVVCSCAHELVRSSCIFIGPEGGFTPTEIDFFEQQKVQPISIGQTVLRTETAAVALAAIVGQP